MFPRLYVFNFLYVIPSHFPNCQLREYLDVLLMEKTGVPGENQRPVAKECVIYFYALLCKRNAGIYLQNMMLCSITMYYITTAAS